MAGDDFDRVRESADLRQFVAENLSLIGNGYECPVCHSGTGPNHSPAFKIMPNGKRWKCFACPDGENAGDIFDLYGILNNTEDKREQLEGVARWAGIPIDAAPAKSTAFGWDDEVEATDAPGNADSGEQGTAEKTGDAEKKAARAPLYWEEREARDTAAAVERGRRRAAEYVETCRGNVEHPACVAYLEGRGCSLEVAKRHGLGYDPERHVLTIPYPGAAWYYTKRSLTGTGGDRYRVPPTDEVGEGAVWDADALNGPVAFIVEGQFDAIAVAECGGRAICANGNKDIARAAKAAAKHPRCFLYLMFDADEWGRKECNSFLLRLEELGAYSFDGVEVVECPHPDPWAWYAADPEGMRAEIRRLIEAVPTDDERFARFAEGLEPEGGDVAEWLDGSEPLSTGIPTLDAALGGGLYSGMHILAAAPGAGKSSLAVQIGINAALAGAGVLYVSLEMSRADVMARCAAYFSRAVTDRGGNTGVEPFTFAEFEHAGARLARTAGGDPDALREAAERDRKTHGMLEILSNLNGALLYRFAIADGRDGSLSDVTGVVGLIKRAAAAGCKLVIVDYLQYIDAGKAAKADDKAERDGYVAKRLTEAAKRLDLKVLALSSVTKSEAGKSARDANAFSAKGSSDIGHDAVTVMRLEHDATTQPAGNTVLTLNVVKNRKGPCGDPIQLEFLAGYATVRDMCEGGPVDDEEADE